MFYPTGTHNHSGLSVFTVTPAEGSIAAGQCRDVTVTFQPDHLSFNYFDRLTVELGNKVSRTQHTRSHFPCSLSSFFLPRVASFQCLWLTRRAKCAWWIWRVPLFHSRCICMEGTCWGHQSSPSSPQSPPGCLSHQVLKPPLHQGLYGDDGFSFNADIQVFVEWTLHVFCRAIFLVLFCPAEVEVKEKSFTVLVTMQASNSAGVITPAVRLLQVGCINSTPPSKKVRWCHQACTAHKGRKSEKLNHAFHSVHSDAFLHIFQNPNFWGKMPLLMGCNFNVCLSSISSPSRMLTSCGTLRNVCSTASALSPARECLSQEAKKASPSLGHPPANSRWKQNKTINNMMADHLLTCWQM